MELLPQAAPTAANRAGVACSGHEDPGYEACSTNGRGNHFNQELPDGTKCIPCDTSHFWRLASVMSVPAHFRAAQGHLSWSRSMF
mmetsp:Transcript_112661/g.224057  ORF Transcript_112661/g.224057 Transcript_112661/m.224057 type:complete len:85 (-) Transcript_112661:183-437(-)